MLKNEIKIITIVHRVVFSRNTNKIRWIRIWTANSCSMNVLNVNRDKEGIVQGTKAKDIKYNAKQDKYLCTGIVSCLSESTLDKG